MPTLPFYKYQGTGNDFTIIDNRETIFDSNHTALITRLCDRKFGIGSDGLILINRHPAHDFEMIYFNADATRSGCGNGARCAVHLAHHLGIIRNEARFLMEGDAYLAYVEADHIRIRMVDVPDVQPFDDGLLLNTGTRHFVRFIEGLPEYDVVEEGRALRYEPRFQPVGANINFVEVTDGQVHMRIYEKGVENETLSSGTGVTAVALATSLRSELAKPYSGTYPGRNPARILRAPPLQNNLPRYIWQARLKWCFKALFLSKCGLLMNISCYPIAKNVASVCDKS